MILSIDAGTTGVTVLVVDEKAQIVSRGYAEFPQIYPQPGWISHNPEQIWDATMQACTIALATIDKTKLAGIGITNQRETTVVWDRNSGAPIDDAIVWQCRRTAPACERLREKGLEEIIRSRTGLVLDPYFSATKIAWLLDNNSGAREKAEAGELAFGTIDSWLVHKFSNGQVHATDTSNASRTSLFSLKDIRFDEELCEIFNVPAKMLPEVVDSSGAIATTNDFLGLSLPICAIAGDQQAALFGQGGYATGRSKCTYGTGSFLLMNCGPKPIEASQGLLSTVAWTIKGETTYALEAAIFITGATLGWLRDELGIVSAYDEVEPLAASVESAAGVVLVPAFAGLGSPWWDPHARGMIAGLTRGSSKAHLARAALDAMAHQTSDVLDAMHTVSGTAASDLRVDGGAVRMNLLCQTIADVAGINVLRPVVQETTALGAAFLGGIHLGMWDGPQDVDNAWQLDQKFEPRNLAAERKLQRDRWLRVVDACRAIGDA